MDSLAEEQAVAGKWAKIPLTEAEIKALSDCVRQAELKTDGEIVPMIVRRSVSGRTAEWVLSLLLFVILEPLFFLLTDWKDLPLLFALVALAAVVWILPRPLFHLCPWLERMLIHSEDLHAAVETRALLELEDARIRHTQRRTGILIFVSWFEHKAVILGDEGIAAKVPNEVWHSLVQDFIDALRAGKVFDGFEHSIRRTGEILSEHFPAQSENQNEISNDLIIKN